MADINYQFPTNLIIIGNKVNMTGHETILETVHYQKVDGSFGINARCAECKEPVSVMKKHECLLIDEHEKARCRDVNCAACNNIIERENAALRKENKDLKILNEPYKLAFYETLSKKRGEALIAAKEQLDEANMRLHIAHEELEKLTSETFKLANDKEVLRKQLGDQFNKIDALTKGQEKKPHKCPVCDGKSKKIIELLSLQGEQFLYAVDKGSHFELEVNCHACEKGIVWR